MAETAAPTITVAGRFNGPASSGNGGYAGGLFAELVDGPAEVSLRNPVPLDSPLTVGSGPDGSFEVRDGETLIAQVAPAAPLDLEVPGRVSIAEATVARERYEGVSGGLFSRCFVCGLDRDDSLGLFAGPVEGGELVASPWTPPEWTADADGTVRPEFVWAVLDCPTYFALYRDETPLSFLVSISARIDGPIRAGDDHVVVAWEVAKDGRKHHAGSAVLAAEGEPLAIARGLLINTEG